MSRTRRHVQRLIQSRTSRSVFRPPCTRSPPRRSRRPFRHRSTRSMSSVSISPRECRGWCSWCTLRASDALLRRPTRRAAGSAGTCSRGHGVHGSAAISFESATDVLWLALARFIAGFVLGATTSVATAAMSDLEPYRDQHHVVVAVAANFGGSRCRAMAPADTLPGTQRGSSNLLPEPLS